MIHKVTRLERLHDKVKKFESSMDRVITKQWCGHGIKRQDLLSMRSKAIYITRILNEIAKYKEKV